MIMRAIATALFTGLLIAGISTHAADAQTFAVDASVTGIDNVYSGSVAWGDYDNDGDLDLLVAGYSGSGYVTKIFRNNAGTFSDLGVSLPGIYQGAVAWGDYNNDGYLDIALTGSSSTGYLSRIYRNNGDNTFTDLAAGLVGVYNSSIAWGDYDNDGKPDILLTGYNSSLFASPYCTAKLYHNNGDGTFTDINAGLTGVYNSSSAWGDYDKDGRLDILLTGYSGVTSPYCISKIYHNNGNGTFTDIAAGLISVYNSSVAWGDYDNDGDLDVLLSGSNDYTSPYYFSSIYRNDGGGVFTDISAGLTGISDGSVAWGDYDNDGDLDVLMSGYNGSTSPYYFSRIYRNGGSGTFTDIVAGLPGLQNSSAAWGDYTNDGKLDFVLTGYTGSAGYTRLFKDTSTIVSANVKPSAPAGLTAVASACTCGVVLSWNRTTDNVTPQNGLSYNIRIGTSAGGSQIIAPLASASTGYRSVAGTGNTGSDTSWSVGFLQAGTYYWSVQAVDGGLAGSSFATEAGFTIGAPSLAFSTTRDSIIDTVIQGTAFRDTIVAASGSCGTVRYRMVSPSPAGMTIDSATGIISWMPSDSGKVPLKIEAQSNMCKVWLTDTMYVKPLFGLISTGLTGATQGGIAWGDYNNDGKQDFIATGYLSPNYLADVYRNNGNGTFAKINAGITGVEYGSAVWGDYDGDGWLDLIVTGYNSSGYSAKIYRNNGSGTFTDINAGLTGVDYSSAAWGDYDNDGRLDLLLTGTTNGSYTGANSKIYHNNGGNSFSDINAGLTGVVYSSVAWCDYDGDGDLDIGLTGQTTGSTYITRVYNNNQGVFTGVNDLPGVYQGSAVWGDYDGDGRPDLLVTGYSSTGNLTKVYRNTGSGVFTDASATLPALRYSSGSWGDYDNDGDLDILLCGYNSSTIPSPYCQTKIYRNTGGIFSPDSAKINGVYNGNAAWGDYDGDGRLDILLTGNTGAQNVLQIYHNNGRIAANAPPAAPVGLASTAASCTCSVRLSWNKSTDAQTAQNSLTYNLHIWNSATGAEVLTAMADTTSGTRRTACPGNAWYDTAWTVKYLPSGTYRWSVQAVDNSFAGSAFATAQQFTVASNTIYSSTADSMTQTAWQQITYRDTVTASAGSCGTVRYSLAYPSPAGMTIDSLTGIIAMTPADTGRDSVVVAATSNGCRSYLRFGITVRPLFSAAATTLPALEYSTTSWGDYNNDNLVDVLVTGYNGSSYVSRLFRNNGNGNFIDVNAAFIGVEYGSVNWGDYDNDGYLDVLMTGIASTGPVSKVYRNDRNGGFSETAAGLTGVRNGTGVWGDCDNDGDLDILLSGYTAANTYFADVYRNDGGTFTALGTGLAGARYAAAAWGDYDNDGDLDIVLTGYTGNEYIAKIYRNDGDFFTNTIDLTGVYQSSVAWGDYDNDGRLDILLSGYSSSGVITRIYRNTGGAFTDITAGLVGLYYGSVAWGDYNNDGRPDVLLTGYNNSSSQYLTKIYRNDSNNVFTDINASLEGVEYGSAAWGDYDNDGRLDIALNGMSDSLGYFGQLYHNSSTAAANTAPVAPAGLASVMASCTCSVALRWNRSTDAQTPKNGLTYNLRIGTTPGGCQILSPFSDSSSGKRRAIAIGNVGGDTAWVVRSLPSGTYYWSVQAVDGAFAGSVFAAPDSFAVTSPLSLATTADSMTQVAYQARLYRDTVRASSTCGSGVVFSLIPPTPSAMTIGSANGIISWTPGPNDAGDRVVMARVNQSGCESVLKYTLKVPAVFSRATAVLKGASGSSLVCGDYDNDGNQDMLISGYNDDAQTNVSAIYHNNGNGTFTDINAPIIQTGTGCAAWGDFDNDNDLDLLLSGKTSTGTATKLYRNDAGMFTDIGASIDSVSNSAAAWGDFNGDGLLDFVLAGNSASKGYVTELYRNNGDGTFTDIKADLPGVIDGAAAWGDFDKDGSLDLLLCGYSSSYSYIMRIYHNNGNNNFSDIAGRFTGMRYASAAVGDYNNDGFLDILVTGYTGSSNVSRIYRNNGAGSFSDIGAPLTGVTRGSGSFADYDNDGDLDVFITGVNVATVFQNTAGVFGATANPIKPLYNASAAWADFDNDGKLDILLSGAYDTLGSTLAQTSVYHNNIDSANSAPSAPPSLTTTTTACSCAVVLKWNKGSDDRTPAAALTYNLRVGTTKGGMQITSPMANMTNGYCRRPGIGIAGTDTAWVLDLQQGKYFWSVQSVDGSFAGSPWSAEDSFTIAAALNFTTGPESMTGTAKPWRQYRDTVAATVSCGSAARFFLVAPTPSSMTIDSITGIIGWQPVYTDSGTAKVVVQARKNGCSKLLTYALIVPPLFRDMAAGLPMAQNGRAVWGDYDNDGDLDVAVTGDSTGIFTGAFTRIYRNDGTKFTDIRATLVNVTNSCAAWGDYDGDGLIDLVAAGDSAGTGNYPVTKLYHNNGGNFNEVKAGLTGVRYGAVAFADFDNDGDQDLIVSGYSWNSTVRVYQTVTKLYRNDRGSYSDLAVPLIALRYSSVAWADYDKDSDLDLLLAGYSDSLQTPVTRLYRNDNGAFLSTQALLAGVQDGSVAWGDYDGDGDPDILMTGRSPAGKVTRVYRNDNGSFVNVLGSFATALRGTAQWCDYDNNGTLDFAVGGDYVSKLYRNNDSGSFVDAQVPLTGVAGGSVAWGDVDNDRSPDLLISGATAVSSASGITRVYRNLIDSANAAPSAPDSLTATVVGSSVTLAWKKANDSKTKQNGLNYNLRVGSTVGGNEIVPSMSSAAGLRRVAAMGNTGNTTAWTLKNLPCGSYHWSVQSIDNGLVGSAFQNEMAFDITIQGVVFITRPDQTDTVALQNTVYSDTVLAQTCTGGVRYSLLSLSPAAMTIDSLSGIISWLPTKNDSGRVAVGVVARNSVTATLLDTLDFSIIVRKNVEPVVIANTPASLSDTIIAGQTWRDTILALGQVGRTIHYRVITGPGSLRIDSLTGVMTWAPDTLDIGRPQVTIAAVDSIFSDTVQFVLTVLKHFGSDFTPPVFSGFSPDIVSDTSVFKIRCIITDASGIFDDTTGSKGQGVYLKYSTAGSPDSGGVELKMSLYVGSTYMTDSALPKQRPGTFVRYKVYACDNNFPRNNPLDRNQGISAEQFVTVQDDDNNGPMFSGFLPTTQSAGQKFRITAIITDPSGVYDDTSGSGGQGMYLRWDSDGEVDTSYKVLKISRTRVDTFATDSMVPSQTVGSNFAFRVYAYDNDTDWAATDRKQGTSALQRISILDPADIPPTFVRQWPDSTADSAGFRIYAIIHDSVGVFDDTVGAAPKGVSMKWDDDGEIDSSLNTIKLRRMGTGDTFVTVATIPMQKPGAAVIYQVSAWSNVSGTHAQVEGRSPQRRISVYDDDALPPTFDGFIPATVAAGDSVLISADLYDASGIFNDSLGSRGQGVYLKWAVGANPNQGAEIRMVLDKGNRYRAVGRFLAPNRDTIVSYQILAFDNDYDRGDSTDRTRGESMVKTITVMAGDSSNHGIIVLVPDSVALGEPVAFIARIHDTTGVVYDSATVLWDKDWELAKSFSSISLGKTGSGDLYSAKDSIRGLRPYDVVVYKIIAYGHNPVSGALVKTETSQATILIIPATISGIVRNLNKKPLGNAQVSVLSGTSIVAQTQTNSAGYYSIPGLSVGNCLIKTVASGYYQTVDSVSVSALRDTFDVATWRAGNFNRDSLEKIDEQDLTVFAGGWKTGDKMLDIGPSIGTAPDISYMPDGFVNYDDLMSFAAMWRWQRTGGVSKMLAKSAANGTVGLSVIPGDVQTGTGGISWLPVIVRDLGSAKAVRVTVYYDPAILRISDSIATLNTGSTTAITFRDVGKGVYESIIVHLGYGLLDLKPGDTLLKVPFIGLADGTAEVRISCAALDAEAVYISSGTVLAKVPAQRSPLAGDSKGSVVAPPEPDLEARAKSGSRGSLVIVPNPARPSNRVSEPFELKHKPWASSWTVSENAGVTLFFDLTFIAKETQFPDAAVPVEGYMAIYDIVGNRIALTPKADLGGLCRGANASGMVKVYWNGRDLNGQKAVPGVYRVVLTYISSRQSGSITGKVGIKW